MDKILLLIIILTIIAWLVFCVTAISLFKSYPTKNSYHKNERIVK
jgi:hypothetical protein